mmetsp:Transcript_63566/g.151624  ORF Transcript_63566/g.151624 Transcript_63566/m.151624 type:complete len:224 (+) Transcript_63566:1345-2016(+)
MLLHHLPNLLWDLLHEVHCLQLWHLHHYLLLDHMRDFHLLHYSLRNGQGNLPDDLLILHMCNLLHGFCILDLRNLHNVLLLYSDRHFFHALSDLHGWHLNGLLHQLNLRSLFDNGVLLSHGLRNLLDHFLDHRPDDLLDLVNDLHLRCCHHCSCSRLGYGCGVAYRGSQASTKAPNGRAGEAATSTDPNAAAHHIGCCWRSSHILSRRGCGIIDGRSGTNSRF